MDEGSGPQLLSPHEGVEADNESSHHGSVEASASPARRSAEDVLQCHEKRSFSARRPPTLLGEVELERIREDGETVLKNESKIESPTASIRRALQPAPLRPMQATHAPELVTSEIQEEREELLSPGSIAASSVHSDYGILPLRVTKDSPWLSFLEEEYAQTTVESGSKLDNLMREVRKAKRNQSTLRGSALYALLRNTYVQVFMFLFLLFNAYLFVTSIQVFSRYKRNITTVKFKVLAAADSTRPATLTNVASMGVLAKGCELDYETELRSADTLELFFTRETEMDGWFFATNGSDASWDPAAFEIWVEDAGSPGEQELLPFNNFRAGVWEPDSTSSIWRVEAQAERGRVTLRLEPPLAGRYGTVVVAGVLTAATGLVLVLSLRDRLLEARLVTGAAVLATGLVGAAVAGTLLCAREGGLSFKWLRTALSCTLMAPPVLASRLKHLLISTIILASLLHLALLLADLALRAREEDAGVFALLWLTHETYVAGGGLVLAVALVHVQRRLFRDVSASAQAGKQALDEAWESALAALGDTRRQTMADMSERVRQLSRRARTRPRQQLVPAHKEAFLNQRGKRSRLLSISVLDINASGTVVRSLDQLYAQAKCCRILLQDRAKHLALLSGGMFPHTARQQSRSDKPPLYVPWEQAANDVDGEYAAAIAWAPLKPVKRAIDKALNHYVGDVSRLFDICRETIVLPDLAHVVQCLDAIAKDRTIEVDRVQNSLKEKLDTSTTGGFRAVVLNVRIVNAASKTMGVHGHVCELVLLPRCLAENMSEEEFQAFRRLRDAEHESGAATVCKSLRRFATCLCKGRNRRERTGSGEGGGLMVGSFTPRGSAAGGLQDRSGRPSSAGVEQATDGGGSSVASLSLLDTETPLPCVTRHNHTSGGPLLLQALAQQQQQQQDGESSQQQQQQQQGGGSWSTPRVSQGTPHSSAPPALTPMVSNTLAQVGSSHAPPSLVPTTPTGARLGLPRGLSFGSLGTAGLGGGGAERAVSRRMSMGMLSALRRGSEAVAGLLGVAERPRSGAGGSLREMLGGLREEFEPQGGNTAWYRLMEAQYKQRTTSTEEKLNDKKYRISFAVQHSDALAVFDTSFPIAAAMCKPWFLATAGIIGVLYLSVACTTLLRLASLGRVSARWLWFKVLELRGGLPVNGAERVGGMGVMRGACPEEVGESLVEAGALGGGWQVQLPSASSLNGFFFHTAEPGHDRNLDPVGYVIQASEDGATWETVAGWHRTFPLGGLQRWPRHASHAIRTPDADEAVVGIDFRPPLFVWLCGPVPNLLLAVTWLLVGLFGLAHYRQWGQRVLRQVQGGLEFWLVCGKTTLVVGLWVSAGCLLVGAGAMQAGGYFDYAALHWLWAVASLLPALVVSTVPQLLIEVLALWGLAGVVLHAISDLATHPAPISSGEGEHHAPPMLLVVIGVSLALVRWRSRIQSLREVLEDVGCYQEAWDAMLRHQERGLRLVREGVEELASKCTDKRALLQQFVPPLRPALRLDAHKKRRHTPFLDKLSLAGLCSPAADSSLRRRWFTRSIARSPSADAPQPGAPTDPRSGGPGNWSSQEDVLKVGTDLPSFETVSPPGVGRVKMWCESDLEKANPAPGVPSNGSRRQRRRHRQHPPLALHQPGLGDGEAGAEVRRESSSDLNAGRERRARRALAEAAALLGAGAGAGAGQRAGSSDSGEWRSWEEQKEWEEGEGRSAGARSSTDTSPRAAPAQLQQLQITIPHHLPPPPPAQPPPLAAHPARRHLTGASSLSVLARRQHKESSGARGLAAAGRGGAETERGGGETERLGDVFQRASSSVSTDSNTSRTSPHGTSSSLRSGLHGLRRQGTFLSRVKEMRRQGTSRFVKELFGGGYSSVQTLELTGRERRAPVECLDQLYAQAAGVLPHLKHKVQAWALESGGMFAVLESRTAHWDAFARGVPGTRGAGFERWERLVSEHGAAEAAARVKWASIKDAGRAVEKTLRSYDGKVARLLDVCRQSIVFDAATDIAKCLELIAKDADVEVLAIKNRFDPDYDAKSLSLGYRDVNLNLRFITPACRRLGIHLHICEVQLLCKEFAQLKNDAGHKRYVAFRNARGK